MDLGCFVEFLFILYLEITCIYLTLGFFFFAALLLALYFLPKVIMLAKGIDHLFFALFSWCVELELTSMSLCKVDILHHCRNMLGVYEHVFSKKNFFFELLKELLCVNKEASLL
jgi:hypothetical protein